MGQLRSLAITRVAAASGGNGRFAFPVEERPLPAICAEISFGVVSRSDTVHAAAVAFRS